MLNTRSIANVDVANKRVLLRVDLNVPVVNGNIADSIKIDRALATIQHLVAKGAKVILLSHFGRPGGKPDASLSLKFLVPILSSKLGFRVKFCPDLIGLDSAAAVERLVPSDVLLLDNLRFHPGEEANDSAFVNALARLGDVYVNDAFSCSHREHASIVGVTNLLPSYTGLLLEREVRDLDMVLGGSVDRAVVAIIGGKKISTKLAILRNLCTKVEYLIVAGAMSNTFLKAQGLNIGRSFYEPLLLDVAEELLKNSKSKIILPADVMCEGCDGNTVLRSKSSVGNEEVILDIGPQSCVAICNVLEKVKVVVWNGPLGLCEEKEFAFSTNFIARYIAALTSEGKLLSIAGGGETAATLVASGMHDYFSYISTAGGAFLEWLEGKDLPGIAALRKAKGRSSKSHKNKN